MAQREILPALTPLEVDERDQVYHHAVRRGIMRDENARVKVHVRCNQPTSGSLASVCPWDKWIETRAATAERDGKRAIAQHVKHNHPSQSPRLVAGRAWVNLADIGG